MFDNIIKIGNSTVQHGKNNNRVYLLKMDKRDAPVMVIEKIEALAKEHSYTKLFAKIPARARDDFLTAGFVEEAHIPKFYSGKDTAFFMAKFLDPARAALDPATKAEIEKIIRLATSKRGQGELVENPDFVFRTLSEYDIPKLTGLYRTVFKFYPFPIFEDAYIRKTMQENIIYFGAFSGENLVAASSAEMDAASQNVEMTDFATDPDFTGNGLALHLLQKMEIEMRKREIKTLYTIARSHSAGMNITFAKADYAYSGTLINSTHISDRIESMNVWYKLLG